jgi:hypothetical protein
MRVNFPKAEAFQAFSLGRFCEKELLTLMLSLLLRLHTTLSTNLLESLYVCNTLPHIQIAAISVSINLGTATKNHGKCKKDV